MVSPRLYPEICISILFFSKLFYWFLLLLLFACSTVSKPAIFVAILLFLRYFFYFHSVYPRYFSAVSPRWLLANSCLCCFYSYFGTTRCCCLCSSVARLACSIRFIFRRVWVRVRRCVPNKAQVYCDSRDRRGNMKKYIVEWIWVCVYLYS